MTSAYLPSILVPLIGIIFPGLAMSLLFLYIEEENIT
jgi:photosystem I subunit VIII|uniref:Photosystem I reaction center subunit VIII n=1 Tax=Thorea hispida TaxID=202687 RepID=A0A1C9CAI9_9FLOR|nr:photosystem I subunit VIII [Thorea hispida]AOM65385.1 photosystem I subunit VIII [Thorea hispida]ARX95948.1 photosystem I subunit VIII [Thorea hispida]